MRLMAQQAETSRSRRGNLKMHTTRSASAIPFSAELLDSLLDEAGIDLLVATSKHNVRYLLGGHRALFFDYMDAGREPLPADLRLCEGCIGKGRVLRPPT
jgi:hypothetical protein